MTSKLKGDVFVSILTEELKVDEGSLSSSNNAQRRHGLFSRSKDPEVKVDTTKGTICDPCVNRMVY